MANNRPVTAKFGEKDVLCVVCDGTRFVTREIKLNTTGMEFLDLGWANQSATGLVCTQCGYIHEFVGNALSLFWAD